MIITQTPFRMSFFGGGTDMPEFFNEYGGSVLSTTFDKYCYITVRHLPRFFDYTSEFVYSQIERIKCIDEIDHPLIRNTMKYMDMHELRLNYEADLPARTGLGTSSSFAVGMINAFYAMKGKYADKKKLADEAIHIERNLCAESGGWQDQIAASFGGFNRIDFKNNSYTVTPVIMPAEKKNELNSNLLMFFTGFTRNSSEIQKKNLSGGIKTGQLKEMLALVDDAEKTLEDKNADLDDFGRLLNETWKLKRETGGAISNGYIDELYDAGMKAGALGGKLLGAGGGGFLVFYARKENHKKICSVFKNLLKIPFSFEEGGTRIVYYLSESYDRDSAQES